jgi:SAM-dependent methyltransferase
MTDFDAKARTWDDDPAKVERAERVAEAIRRELGDLRASSVLEYGCGTGLLGFALQPFVGRLTLADTSTGMLDVLRRKIAGTGARNMTPVLLDLTRGDVPPERFDVVCTLLTLHHIREVDPLLARFHDLLEPGGALCLSDLDAEDGSFHGPGADVHRGFDRAELGLGLERAGFRGVRFGTPYVITKGAGPAARSYPVFLAVGRRG